jgi:transposase
MRATVIQYLRPDGRKSTQFTTLPDKVEPLYKAMQAKGWRLAAEVLRTGEVVTYIERHDGETIKMRLMRNDPQVQQSYVDMLEEAIKL